MLVNCLMMEDGKHRSLVCIYEKLEDAEDAARFVNEGINEKQKEINTDIRYYAECRSVFSKFFQSHFSDAINHFNNRSE